MKKITQLIFLLLYSIAFSQSVATYDIIFESYWNASDHSTLPPSPHWSSLVGANHNSNVTFIEMGGIATQGIESIAEIGDFTIFRDDEVQPAITNGNAEQFINAGGLGNATGIIAINGLEVSEEFPLISLVSMIAPSPDWMVAINNVNLRNAGNTDWQNLIEINVFVYDAGTDSGSSYTAANADVTPHIAINSLQNISPFNNNPVGKFTITLQSVLGVNESQTFNKIKIYPNPTTGIITISNINGIELNKIRIYNILGTLVKEVSIEKGLSNKALNLEALSNGVYLVKLIGNKGEEFKKIVIN